MEDSGISSVGESSNSDMNFESQGNDIITEVMIKEELELEKQAIKDENNLRESVLKEEKERLEEQCYKRLNLLLSRSSIYAQFMADKLKRENLKEAKKQARSEKLKDTQSTAKKSMKRKNETSSSSNKISCNKITVMDIFKTETVNCEKGKQNDENDGNFDNQGSCKSNSAIHKQPLLLTGGVMHPYQIEGFEWIKTLFENGVNAILADEMGLGKTIQTIAFIAYLLEMGISGPFFICGPLSTITNWFLEFQRFTPSVPAIIYHGDKFERKKLRSKILKKVHTDKLSSFPVVITSYQIALFDCKHLSHYGWKLLVVDEAHRIKNFQCKLITALKSFNSMHRLLLTGTPLQNNLSELWSLLNFILPEIFDDLKVFESWFDITRLTANTKDIVAKEQEKQIVSIIHQILTPFLLRRTKADVQLNLPEKKEVIIQAPLTKLQQEYYTAALNKTIKSMLTNSEDKYFPVDVDINSGRPKRNRNVNYADICEKYNDNKFKDINPSTFNNSLSFNKVSEQENSLFADVKLSVRNILMLLRKICGHPYLVSYPLEVTGAYKIDEDLVKSSGKFLVLDMLLPEMKKRGHKILIFSQFVTMLEILGDYCTYRKYSYNILHGKMNLQERDEEIKKFNNSPDFFIFLISTRAGGLGINLASADTVILYDSDWNPQCDLQAQDRCHRIGQTKPVVVYRLIVPNTIDEHIVNRATAKRKLEKVIMKKGRFSSRSNQTAYEKMSIEELIELLQSCEYNGFVKTDENAVLSPSELEKILDRSEMV